MMSIVYCARNRPLLLLVRGMGAVHPVRAASGAGDVRSVVDRAATRFYHDNPQAVGVSVSVYRGGRSYFYSFGSTMPGGHEKPSPGAMYPIASITKTFTGILVAQAALDGRLK